MPPIPPPVGGWPGALYSDGSYWPPRSGPCREEHILVHICPRCVSLAPPNLKVHWPIKIWLIEIWDLAEEREAEFEVLSPEVRGKRRERCRREEWTDSRQHSNASAWDLG